MIMKEGTLLEGLPGHGPFAGFEIPIKEGLKISQKIQKYSFYHIEKI
jgi:hypothetical protein